MKAAYLQLKETSELAGIPMPKNKPIGESKDLLLKHLDCAVIQTAHEMRRKEKLRDYDSVRGVFWEGEELYPRATFAADNHIQICIRNPNCIKGYFRPLKINKEYPDPSAIMSR